MILIIFKNETQYWWNTTWGIAHGLIKYTKHTGLLQPQRSSETRINNSQQEVIIGTF